jgi:acetylglutamate kinase
MIDTPTRQTDATGIAAVLVEVLPYIQRFRGEIVVVKVGGSALVDDAVADQFATDIALMHMVGIRPVVVHGGGPQISSMMERLGEKVFFDDGLRVTDSSALDITRMVLVGKINRDLVTRINRHGSIALGVSGEDANLLIAEQRDPRLGFVGDVTSVNTDLINRLLNDGLVPVIATVASDGAGQAYNVNADAGASAIAAELGATKIIYLTDVDGLYEDPSDRSTLIRQTTATRLREAITSGNVGEGMIPKLEGCLTALARGVPTAHILGGATAHPLLVEIFTDDGIGTMVSRGDEL